MIRCISLFAFILLGIVSNAQKCFDYHKEHCQPPQSKFAYQINDQSVAYKFSPGELRRIPIELKGDKDYRITLCGDSVFDGIILFVIKDELGKEIYNNSNRLFALNLEFSSKKKQDVIFELAVADNTNGNTDSTLIEGCVGILIEEMNTLKTGF